jgi:hypothetical protein
MQNDFPQIAFPEIQSRGESLVTDVRTLLVRRKLHR